MNLVSIIGLSTAMLVLAASPGPGVFATVARSLASGFSSSLAVIAGIVAGDIIFVLFAVFGLSLIAKTLGELFVIVRIGGGLYLCWLGVRIWFAAPSANDLRQVKADPSPLADTTSGLLITLSNPKVIVFYCSFLPTFMDLSVLTAGDISIVVGVIAVILTAVLTAYAYAASSARRLFSSPRALKRLHRCAGGVMAATGVTIAVKS